MRSRHAQRLACACVQSSLGTLSPPDSENMFVRILVPNLEAVIAMSAC